MWNLIEYISRIFVVTMENNFLWNYLNLNEYVKEFWTRIGVILEVKNNSKIKDIFNQIKRADFFFSKKLICRYNDKKVDLIVINSRSSTKIIMESK